MISCRAVVHDDCYDGRPDAEIYESGSQSEDGAWDGHSVICDSCLPLIEPFANDNDRPLCNDAICHYRDSLTYVQAHENPHQLIAEAQSHIDTARAGSPSYRSAAAAKRMAEKEVERRGYTHG